MEFQGTSRSAKGHGRWVATIKEFIVLSLVITHALAIPNPALAADGDGPGPSSGPRRHLATIIFSGLGGAVLGLSTLSFYGRPQDKLGNIGVGFALGIIAGTVYVTYEMVKSPNEFYGLSAPPPDANDHRRWTAPADLNYSSLPGRYRAPPAVSITQFNWSF